LVVVAARTAMGKSILGIEIADRVARQGYGVVYHSLEMSRLQVAARQISSRLERKGRRVSFEAILRAERLTRDDAEAVALQASELRDESLLIEDRGGVSIASIAAATERRIAAFERKGVRRGIVVIDHAHQVAASGRHDREEGRIREVSAGALALAKRLDMPVVLLAQLNRQTEARDDKRPGPADLRGSGALEEDCDALIFPFRPAYYIERSARYRAGDPAAIAEYEAAKHALELILDKNRAGRSNQVIHAWIDPALNAIRNRGERRDIP
jgi:replicative DNA helicase